MLRLELNRTGESYSVIDENDFHIGRIIDNGYRFRPYDSDINLSDILSIGEIMKGIVSSHQPEHFQQSDEENLSKEGWIK